MKNTIFILAATVFLGAAVHAQSTVDSINAKYQLLPMPVAMTIEKTFPILGSYQLNNAQGTPENVMISLDPENKGIVWIEGLPQGKMKAYLKKAPATYRIISQKSETGKQISEGTLMLDQETNNLHIALGKPFDMTNPEAIFNLNPTSDMAMTGTNEVKIKSKNASSKTKSKVLFYTAIKADPANTSADPAAVNTPNQQ